MHERSKLETLLNALDASPRALRKDACGDWTIRGKAGQIFADGDGWADRHAGRPPLKSRDNSEDDNDSDKETPDNEVADAACQQIGSEQGEAITCPWRDTCYRYRPRRQDLSSNEAWVTVTVYRPRNALHALI